jgi:hypothetical protein
MLIDVLLLLNTVSAIWGGRLLFKQTRNYAVWLFELMFAVLFVIRPLAISSFGLVTLDLVRFDVGPDALLIYLLCGLLFSVVFHWVVYRFYRRARLFTDRILPLLNFDGVSTYRVGLMVVLFLLLTYAVNALKYHSLTYFAENPDAFEAMMRLSGGHWYLEILSGILIFPLVVLLARHVNSKPAKLACLLIAVMAAFSVLAKPSTRAFMVCLLVAAATYSFSVGKIRLRIVTVTVVLTLALGLLLFLNFVRLGNARSFGEEASLPSIVIGPFQNAVAADDAMILIDYLKHHPWLYFRYLLPSLTPLPLVPSAVFPFKPRTDMESVLTYNIFGFDLDPAAFHEASTLTYTVPVAGYANLGFIGVPVSALIYGLIFSAFLRSWKSKSTTVRFIGLFYLVFLIGGLRLSADVAATSFYWTVLVTWSMHFFCRLQLLPDRVGGRPEARDPAFERP